jgi:hypothetical protein
MAERASSTTALIEIDRLYEFLGNLQTSGYELDARHYIALSDLLMFLIARGEPLDDLNLKTLIAPVICSTPTEQEDFYSRFDRWYRSLQPTLPDVSSGEPLPSPEKAQKPARFPLRLRISWLWIVFAFGIVIVLALIPFARIYRERVYLIFGKTVIAFVSQNLVAYGGILIFLGLAAWLGGVLWKRYRENQYITREASSEEPVHRKVPVTAYLQEVLPPMQFKPVVSALRRRVRVPSKEVDVNRTIETTLQSNNWLEVVYRQRHFMPEYVVLIDRKSRHDQQARFVQEVLQHLALDGVWLHQYEFSGDPRLCFPMDHKDVPLHLKDVQARHPDARLLVFSGATELKHPLTGHLQDWVESLSQWGESAIFTPDRIHRSLYEELQERDLTVLPMSLEGLASLVRAFEQDSFGFQSSRGPALPAPLLERPLRWTGRDAPTEPEIASLLQQLRRFLGENGFYWLCACTVYPELRWELTLFLGSALRDDRGRTLLDPEILVRLARLPWFRHGYMPDWMRLALIQTLNPGQEALIRDAIARLLSTAFQGEGFDLLFSRKASEPFAKKTRRFLDALTRNSPPGSALNDHIFLKFLATSRLKRLAVQIPNAWNTLKEMNPVPVVGAQIRGLARSSLEALAARFQSPGAKEFTQTESEVQARPSNIEASVPASSKNTIFVSYARKDTVQAQETIRYLKAEGFDLGFDATDLTVGADWVREIENSIRDCSAVVAIMSPDAKESEWVQREISYAEERGKRIFPVLVAGDAEKSIPLFLLNRAFVDLRRDRTQGLASLSAALRQSVEEPPETRRRRELGEPGVEVVDTAPQRIERQDPQLYFGANRELIPTYPSDAYSDGMAWLLAGMSHLAYDLSETDQQTRSLLQGKLRGGGFELVQLFHSTDTDTQAFLAANDDFAVLAFRGPEGSKQKDIIGAAPATAISTIEGRVHSGFRMAYQSLRRDIEKGLVRVSDVPLYITGHSLGAALALVAMQDLEYNSAVRQHIAACYTFGSPRVGNGQFDRSFKTPVYRIVNTTDIVTVTPLLGLGYIHIGDTRYLGRRDGEFSRQIPIMQRLLLFAGALFGFGAAWVRDHAIVEYRRKLKIIARMRSSPSRESPSERPARYK